MAEKDPDGPSLELPKLGFGRRKRGSRIEPEVTDQPTEALEARRTEPRPEARISETRTEPVTRPDLDPAPVGRPRVADDAPTRVSSTVPSAPPPALAEPEVAAEPEPADDQAEAVRPRREWALPRIGGMTASVFTGLLVGVLAVGLTGAGFRLCEVVQGTASCGNPGLLLLVVILVASIYVGSLLLRAFGVPDPGSTSFLAVGLLAVLALLLLVDVLFSPWMLVVIPALTMGTYALAHWVTTSFVEPADH